MGPKPPPADVLETALASTVASLYHGDERDQLSVNLVRQRVESELGFESGFFRDESWKVKSKQIIKDAVDKLESGAPPSSQTSLPPRPPEAQAEKGKGVKRTSPNEASTPAKKRQKTVPKKSEPGLSEPEDSDVSESPGRKNKKPVARSKVARRVVDSDSDGGREPSATIEVNVKPKKAKPAPRKTAAKKSSKRQDGKTSDTDSPLSEVQDEAEDEDNDQETPVGGGDSSESEVIDEPPKRKRKSAGPPPKAPAKLKGTSSRPAAEPSPDEAEIKRLQGQLVKCGVRKIWAFELKKYGDDSRAKMRHLRDMLKDVGMDARFSEAKAREIKERRELLADLEAVTEMNENWGVSVGRASRSRVAAKPMKLPSDGEEDADEDDGGGDGSGSRNGSGDDGDDDDDGPKAKSQLRGSAKYRADMAFLGDESESD